MAAHAQAVPLPATLRLDAAAVPVDAPRVVARSAGHDRRALHEAEALGSVVAGAAVHLSGGRLELGARWDRRPGQLTLPELLAAAAPGTGLMLDLRGVDPRLPRLVARALADAPQRDVTVCSRAWWLLEPLRGHAALAPTVATPRQLGTLLRRCDTTPLDAVVAHHRLLTPARVAALRAMAGQIYAWPVDTRSDATRLAAWGVNGILTDHPQGLTVPGAPGSRSVLAA